MKKLLIVVLFLFVSLCSGIEESDWKRCIRCPEGTLLTDTWECGSKYCVDSNDSDRKIDEIEDDLEPPNENVDRFGTEKIDDFDFDDHKRQMLEKMKCITATGTIGHKKVKYKDCINEKDVESKCVKLRKKGYSSCSTCKGDLCNYVAVKCYKCAVFNGDEKRCSDENYNLCPDGNTFCAVSVGVLNGKPYENRYCGDEYLICEEDEKEGYTCYKCNQDFCNVGKHFTRSQNDTLRNGQNDTLRNGQNDTLRNGQNDTLRNGQNDTLRNDQNDTLRNGQNGALRNEIKNWYIFAVLVSIGLVRYVL